MGSLDAECLWRKILAITPSRSIQAGRCTGRTFRERVTGVAVLILLANLLESGWLTVRGEPATSTQLSFNRDIRPILAENCFGCHGPDKSARKGDLRLDVEAGMLADLGGHRAVVPGQPAGSELWKRLATTKADDRMPPADSGKKLTSAQVNSLKQWIEQGAPWEGHWAYLAPRKAPLPPVHDRAWPLNPIDQFVLARLEREGLAPSVEADKRTLIRRLSFDLTGLPPAPAEVEAFLNDASPQAYEKVVNRLLASPHYGERMAIPWLDLVRYADTVGYHGDQPYSIYPYRDYVINAFNSNLGFDQFTIEQLAGDLLPGATPNQKVASGYNRLNRMTAESGAQDKEYLAKYFSDRVRTTSTVWLASTLGCSECHDHKYDPFTMQDFYRFGAFFADLKEQGYYQDAQVTGQWGPVVYLPSRDQTQELDRLSQRIAELENKLFAASPEMAAAQKEWERRALTELQSNRWNWTSVKPAQASARDGTTLTVLDDASVLASGNNPGNDVYRVTLRTERKYITGIRLEVLTHDSMDHKSLSRGGGNFRLTNFEVWTSLKPGERERMLNLESATADYEQVGYPVSSSAEGDKDRGWSVDGDKLATNHQAAYVFEMPLAGGPGTSLTIRLKHQSQEKKLNIGRFRLSLTSVDRPSFEEQGIPSEIIKILQTAPPTRTTAQEQQLAKYFRRITPQLDVVRLALNGVRKRKEQLERRIPNSLTSQSVTPRMIRILSRGNWMDESGPAVQPGVPHFLPVTGASAAEVNRLDLARWITSPDNPLTARVFVNRLWKLYFGTGISRTLDDFGVQGEWPVHPELLDWLAVEFREKQWDIKHLVKLMVMSRTYRQTSGADAKLRERDPYNRLLARQSSFRLDAELVRDNALAVSGLLAEQIGGPSVKPYQPEGYYAQLNFPVRGYDSDHGASQYRRGLYTHWQRTFLHPSLLAFDAPSRDECTAERVRSNTPLQALVLLDDPTYVEAARALATLTLQSGGQSVEQRLNWIFTRALSRVPTAPERTVLTGVYERQRGIYSRDEEAAKALLTVGEAPVPAGMKPAELAAWTAVARVILNLQESITRD